MDFDFSTLLYILFAIIYFVFSSGKRKKKPSDKPVPPIVNPEMELEQESRPKTPTFEDLLKEFTGETIQKEPEPITPQPVVVEEPKPIEKRAITTAYDKIQHSKMTTEYERFDEFKIEDEEQDDWAAALNEKDGAKKAFIYSEIFKRKY